MSNSINKSSVVESVFKGCMDDIDAGIPQVTPAAEEKETHHKVWVNFEYVTTHYGAHYQCKEITEEMAKGCTSAVQVSVPNHGRIPLNRCLCRSADREKENPPITVASTDVPKFMSVVFRLIGKNLYCPSSVGATL